MFTTFIFHQKVEFLKNSCGAFLDKAPLSILCYNEETGSDVNGQRYGKEMVRKWENWGKGKGRGAFFRGRVEGLG